MSLPIRMSMPSHLVNLRDICIIICSFVPALWRLCVYARLPCLFVYFVFAIGVFATVSLQCEVYVLLQS